MNFNGSMPSARDFAVYSANARAAATASFAWAQSLFREFYIYKIVEGRYMLSNILYDA